jgi:acetyltransferase-like isoleucine patch superfamily enzyme
LDIWRPRKQKLNTIGLKIIGGQKLVIGKHSAITSRHIIDCTNFIRIGEFSTIAGYRSQLLTHSIEIDKNRQWSKPIEIGDYSFVGTNTVILGGSSLPSFSVLGANSLLNKDFKDRYSLLAGVPAVPRRSLPSTYGYFKRKKGFVL